MKRRLKVTAAIAAGLAVTVTLWALWVSRIYFDGVLTTELAEPPKAMFVKMRDVESIATPNARYVVVRIEFGWRHWYEYPFRKDRNLGQWRLLLRLEHREGTQACIGGGACEAFVAMGDELDCVNALVGTAEPGDRDASQVSVDLRAVWRERAVRATDTRLAVKDIGTKPDDVTRASLSAALLKTRECPARWRDDLGALLPAGAR